ncbi:MAG: cytochrome c biogenesis protein ResB, partial [Spirochaetia bacterium]|nr:cytochrome c biogenesis protein ResB [Spirochaetia bacterium]
DDVVIRYKDFYDNAVESLRSSPDGKPAVVLVVSSGGTPDDFTLFAGETYDAGSFIIDFSSGRTFTKPSVKIILDRDDFLFSSPFPVTYMQMADQKSGNLPAGVWNPLSGGKLHTVHGVSFVVRDTKKSAVHTVVKSSQKTNLSAVIVSVESGSEVREVALPGTESSVGQLQKLTLGNKEISLRYGSKNIELPFSLHLTDFIVERYPGSNSPSSYESKVILIDPEMNIKEPKRIYMNHILVHRGFRFYQSSFDPDERGTVLSVAKDPGMIPTYLGYFLMTVGLLFNLFNRRARFGRLTKQVAKEGEKS